MDSGGTPNVSDSPSFASGIVSGVPFGIDGPDAAGCGCGAGIGFHFSHGIPHLPSEQVGFNGTSHATVQIAIGTELTATIVDRIHPEGEFPRGCLEQRIHRRE